MGKYIHFLKQSDIFFNLTDTQLEMVDHLCEDRNYRMSEIITQENAEDDDLFLIMEGEVVIQVDPSLVDPKPNAIPNPSTIATLRRGQSFGEIALVDQGLRTATCRAAAPQTQLIIISRSRLLQLCTTYPELGYRVMFNLATDLSQKVRSADMRIREELFSRQNKSVSS